MPVWIQTSSGLAVDLLAPDLTRIDVRRDIAEPLAGIARFANHRRDRGKGRIWSVAQHCVVGAKALAEEHGPLHGLAFLVHDAHEAFIGDVTTPFTEVLEAEFEGPAKAKSVVRGIIARIRERIDRPIRALAGLGTIPPHIAAAVAEMDLRMLDTERRQILGHLQPRHRAEDIWSPSVLTARAVRTNGALTPWTEKRAADEWMALWDMWRIRPGAVTQEATR